MKHIEIHIARSLLIFVAVVLFLLGTDMLGGEFGLTESKVLLGLFSFLSAILLVAIALLLGKWTKT